MRGNQVLIKKQIYFMRVLFCKLHCPSLICFCKPSPSIYTAGTLKLDNSPHVASTVVSPQSEHQSEEVKEEEILEEEQQQQEEEAVEVEDCLKSKSSLKKKVSSEEKEVQKKKVQWMDFLGKDLVEIREFESNETDVSDYESGYNRSCVCTIL